MLQQVLTSEILESSHRAASGQEPEETSLSTNKLLDLPTPDGIEKVPTDRRGQERRADARRTVDGSTESRSIRRSTYYWILPALCMFTGALVASLDDGFPWFLPKPSTPRAWPIPSATALYQWQGFHRMAPTPPPPGFVTE